jgi:xanthine dehydrogenase accessory factor
MVQRSLENRVPVILLYVLESKGSSPGRQGFFMALNASGEMEGSIGGGIMEHKFVEMAKAGLATGTEVDDGLRKQYHDKSAVRDQSGMICSGEQTIWIYRLKPGDLPTINNLVSSLEQFQHGTLLLSPKSFAFEHTPPASDFTFTFVSESDWSYREKTGYKNQLYIIGGGHCALALSNIMRSMDFYIRVYDERPGLKTMLSNESAHEKHFLADYSQLTSLIPPGSHHYVVIMTFGYRTDDIALRALVGKQFKYLGLLGSRNKIEKMFADYANEGLDAKWLNSIHSPIGMGIRSQTPGEIAISIAAEIIQVKNNPASA